MELGAHGGGGTRLCYTQLYDGDAQLFQPNATVLPLFIGFIS